MISSGMKRGLAATAISAMAVTGLPLLAGTASANSMAEQAGAPDAIELYSPADLGSASIKNDGVNTTVHLVANGGSDVIQVHFEYFDGTWKNIATVSRENGVFSTEWAPPVSVYNLPVQIRATALNNINTPINDDTNTAQVTANQEAIDIANAPGSAVGVFHQPYTTVSGPRAAAANKDLGAAHGTTSDLAGNPSITLDSPSGSGSTTTEDVAGTVAAGDSTRTWSGPVDFSGYTYDSTPNDGTVDQAVVIATDQSNDAEAVTLYKQTITTVTAVAASGTVQGAGTTSATVKVTDQNGNPVVGAEVIREDNSEVKYTNSLGEAKFSGLTGSDAGTTYKFYVNTGDNVAYENGVDFERSVTISKYNPTASSLTPSSADGAAFDDDEYSAGDISILVKDQNGNPVPAGTTVTYYWHVAPFAAQTGYPKNLAEQTGTTDANGKVTAVFPTSEPSGTYTLHSYINQDGTPGQGSGDLGGTDLTVKAGQADITWADGTKAQAPAGTTATFDASLILEDGTGLPSRNIAISWAPTGNAVVSAQASQPAGTTRTSNTTATTVTAADGSFGVALSDPPASPNTDELNGVLTGTTTNTPNIGNAGDSSDLGVDFLKTAGPDSADDITVSYEALINSVLTPGRPADLDITVQNADHTADLTDFPVTVSVDHGFLSPNAETAGALKADPAPAQGGEYGEWKSDGTSKDFTTDDSGDTGAVVAIERDAAFDTAKTVVTTVTIKAGSVTKTLALTFHNNDSGATAPLNGDDVKIERDDQQSVTILPKAPTSESVNYNVYALDQFGNPVEGVDIDLSDDLAKAYMNGQDGSDTVTSQLKNDGAALSLSSDVAGNQTVTGTWNNAPSTVYTDGDPATAGYQFDDILVPGTQPKLDTTTKTVTGKSETVNWYAIDYAASTYTLTHTGADVQPVGTTVTETYKAVDQNGEPLSGFDVTFYRTGPDDLQDGDGNSYATTNQQGEATYVFQGAKAGTATITATLREQDGPNNVPPAGTLIPQGEKSDSVSFKNADPVAIHPSITGKHVPATDTIAGYDKITVAAAKAAGAEVRLFRVKDGVAKRVKTKVLSSNGKAIFKRADLNGDKNTYYYAVVMATPSTKKAQTATIPVK